MRWYHKIVRKAGLLEEMRRSFTLVNEDTELRHAWSEDRQAH
jgi:hypothetical protein